MITLEEAHLIAKWRVLETPTVLEFENPLPCKVCGRQTKTSLGTPNLEKDGHEQLPLCFDCSKKMVWDVLQNLAESKVYWAFRHMEELANKKMEDMNRREFDRVINKYSTPNPE